MSYTAGDKLPEDFFQETIEEKAEMIRKYLKDVGNPLVFSTHIGPNMATFKFYSPTGGGFIKTPLYLFKPRRPAGPIILFVGPTKLCVKGGVNNIQWIKG